MGKIIVIINFFLFAYTFVEAQSLPNNVTQQIDSLFKEWNISNSPGCAIGVVRNDSLIYSKAYGLAVLEHDIPITQKSVFNIASLSKQFTGYAIAMLAGKGLIDLNKEAHHYLKWLPDSKSKITVKHLLYHTSGIRDHLVMSVLGGTGFNGLITQDYAKKYISHYNELNFLPGESHSYSNSNYVLLAEIIKTVTGKPFKEYIDSAIFNPLGMTNPFFIDPPSMIVKNKAESYGKAGNQFFLSSLNVYTNGDGGMYSNISDLAKWVSNFLEPRVGTVNDQNLFIEPGKLNNGNNLNYAMGIGELNYKGKKQLTHSGGIAGYRSRIVIYPEHKIGIIVLSNLANIPIGAKTNQVTDVIFNHLDIKTINNEITTDTNKQMLKDTTIAKQLVGHYLSNDGVQYKIDYTNQKLYLKNFFGRQTPLYEENDHSYRFYNDTTIKITVEKKYNEIILHLYDYGNNRKLKKYIIDSTLSVKEMQGYTGTYYSPELDFHSDIILKDNSLHLKNFKFGEAKIKPVTKTDFFNQTGGTHFEFIKNNKNEIIAYELSTATILHIRFNKLTDLKKVSK